MLLDGRFLSNLVEDDVRIPLLFELFEILINHHNWLIILPVNPIRQISISSNAGEEKSFTLKITSAGIQ